MLSRLGLRFALTYAAIAGCLLAIYAFPFELFGAKQDWLHGYLAAYAHLAGGVLGLFDRTISVDGTLIHGRYPLEIVRNCDAAELNILFGSAILAFPAKVGRKLGRLAGGLAALVAANVLRICSLYYVGVLAPGWFHTLHEEVWPLLLMVFTVSVFLVCIRWAGPAAQVEAV
jgi:exosortase/archaeosortase family protein